MRSLTAIVLAVLCLLVLTVSVDARRLRKLQRRTNSDESAASEDDSQLAVSEEDNPTSSGKRPKENKARDDQALSVPAAENKETEEKSQASSEPSAEENQKKANRNRPRGPLTQLFRTRNTRKPLHFDHNKKQPRPTLPSFLSRSRSKPSTINNSSPDEETSTNNSEKAEPKSSKRQRPKVEDSGNTRRRVNRRRFTRRRHQVNKQDGGE
ncbi:uncharacterized protein LOC143249660 [Tachypleus tridentatus]|uniref:uncharacterized protein LOC143249660 n=1 Tax=Tachypleus tridentatus TaxID=6853 RepID=UPI003FD2CA51